MGNHQVEALTRLVQDGIIKLAHTREEGSVITVSTVDNETAARMILEEIRLEQYKHLRGRKIRVTEAAERYGIEVILMPGVGHFVMMEDPETFNRLLGENVEELAGT